MASRSWIGPRLRSSLPDSIAVEFAMRSGSPSGSAPRPSPAPAGATPAVRALAAQHGVSLASVAGTGVGGRVTQSDVERAAAGAPAQRASTGDALYELAWGAPAPDAPAPAAVSPAAAPRSAAVQDRSADVLYELAWGSDPDVPVLDEDGTPMDVFPAPKGGAW